MNTQFPASEVSWRIQLIRRNFIFQSVLWYSMQSTEVTMTWPLILRLCTVNLCAQGIDYCCTVLENPKFPPVRFNAHNCILPFLWNLKRSAPRQVKFYEHSDFGLWPTLVLMTEKQINRFDVPMVKKVFSCPTGTVVAQKTTSQRQCCTSPAFQLRPLMHLQQKTPLMFPSAR